MKISKKRIADTSILSHLSTRHRYASQETKIVAILEGETLNSRQIHEILVKSIVIDLSSVRRAITYLLEKKRIEIKFKGTCPITRKTVRFYSIPTEQLRLDFN